MSPDTLRALVIDDERLAREELVRELAAIDGVQVVGVANDVAQARELLRRTEPQLALLDIELAEGCGFDLLNFAPPDLRTIVVSAYEAYALRAFEVNVLDYLLKPVQPQRLRAAIARARAVDGGSGSRDAARPGYDDCIFLALEDGRATFLPLNRIAAVEADGDYSRVTTCDGQVFGQPTPLRHWEARLPAHAFVRIHRSTMVNVRRVLRIDAWFNRRFRVHVDGLPKPLMMSRRYAGALKHRFR